MNAIAHASPSDSTAAFARLAGYRQTGTLQNLKQAVTGPNGVSPKTMARIDAAAQDFEANFIAEMMKPMFEGIQVDKTFGGGKGEQVFRGLLLQEYGKKIAASGGIGIASVVRDEMLRQQEGTVK